MVMKHSRKTKTVLYIEQDQNILRTKEWNVKQKKAPKTIKKMPVKQAYQRIEQTLNKF